MLKAKLKNKKFYLKSLSILFLGSLIMANKKCEQGDRQLKKNVRVIGMEASKFLDNEKFSFSEVSQNQLSGVLFEGDQFFERNTYPVYSNAESLPVVQNGYSKASIVNQRANEESLVQLKTWFPEMKSGDVTRSSLSQESGCLITRPQHYIYGKINALEAFSGGALQFGYSPTSTQTITNAGVDIKIDRMRMDLSMKAYDAWTAENMASVNSEAFKNDYKVGFSISLFGFNIGPEFYKQTGMAEVTLKGLKNAVSDLYEKLTSLPRQEWQTRVVLSRDNYVVLLGGAELGLQKGDILKIENEVHDWLGTPCGESSILIGSTSVTSEPWYVEIEDAGNLMSKAKVLNPREDETIHVGALTRVEQLYVELSDKERKKLEKAQRKAEKRAKKG